MSLNNLKVLPVYNVSTETEALFIPFTDVLTLQSVTLSTAVITRSTDGGNFPIDDVSFFLSNIDTVGLIHEGDDTVFDRIYTWTPDFDSKIYKMTFNIACGINISAYTDGSLNIGNLRITVRQRSPDILHHDQLVASGAANQSATGTSYHIYNVDFTKPFTAYAGRPIDIRIQMITTEPVAGTQTRQEGILPVFSFQAAAITKIFTLSGVIIYSHPDINYADPVFKDHLERLTTI